MSIFDLFSNNAQLNAANTIGTGIAQGQAQALPWYQQGIGAVANAYQNAATSAQGGIGNVANAIPTISQTAGVGAAPNWQNFATAQPGVGMYGNALGLGGPAGNAAALQGFYNNPGYQFQLQQGNNAIAANAAKTGAIGSGNEDIALANYNQNLANTSWNNYVSSLAPYLNMSQNAGGTLANVYGGLANTQAGLTGQQTNLYGTLAGLQAAGGNALNAAYGNVGNMYYGGATSAANALAAAQANTSGASNLFNGLLTGGAGLLGGLMAFSDYKLKEDIEPVGALASGETVYRYRYKGDPRTQIGLIAQEVEGSTPEAVVEVLPDLRAVDYHRATERAAKILAFTRERHEPTPTHRPFANELMELAA